MWGWGGEDDVLQHRLASIGQETKTFIRPTIRAGLMDTELIVGGGSSEKRDANESKKEWMRKARAAGPSDGIDTCRFRLLQRRVLGERT